jgi:hypothetical protein
VAFVVDKMALGQVFTENFGFPSHQLLHIHDPSSGTGGPKSGRRTKWTQAHTIQRNKQKQYFASNFSRSCEI